MQREMRRTPNKIKDCPPFEENKRYEGILQSSNTLFQQTEAKQGPDFCSAIGC